MDFDGFYPRKDLGQKKKKSDLLVCFFGVTILGLMFAGIWLPTTYSGGRRPKISQAKSDISVFSNAIDQFRLDCDRYPTTAEGFDVLVIAPPNAKGWRGPYLKEKVPNDPWGNPYRYISPSPSGRGYEVESYGADGQPGGVGDDEDIVELSDTWSVSYERRTPH